MEQDTQDFGSRWELCLRSVFELSHSLQVVLYLLAHHFLAVGFQNSMAEK
jgi:hypothetical protein